LITVAGVLTPTRVSSRAPSRDVALTRSGTVVGTSHSPDTAIAHPVPRPAPAPTPVGIPSRLPADRCDEYPGRREVFHRGTNRSDGSPLWGITQRITPAPTRIGKPDVTWLALR
jgi:hypothetical protein